MLEDLVVQHQEVGDVEEVEDEEDTSTNNTVEEDMVDLHSGVHLMVILNNSLVVLEEDNKDSWVVVCQWLHRILMIQDIKRFL